MNKIWPNEKCLKLEKTFFFPWTRGETDQDSLLHQTLVWFFWARQSPILGHVAQQPSFTQNSLTLGIWSPSIVDVWSPWLLTSLRILLDGFNQNPFCLSCFLLVSFHPHYLPSIFSLAGKSHFLLYSELSLGYTKVSFLLLQQFWSEIFFFFLSSQLLSDSGFSLTKRTICLPKLRKEIPQDSSEEIILLLKS